MASKSKKTSRDGGSEGKRAPLRKDRTASAGKTRTASVGKTRAGARAGSDETTASGSAAAAVGRARRPVRPTDKAKKRPSRTSKAPLGSRSSGRVRALGANDARNETQPDAKRRRQTAESLESAVAAIDAALEKKALLPVLIDVSSLASYTDFIGIVSGRSDRQVEAIADGILACMKARGRALLGQEGSGSGRWTLLDFGDVVFHVFYHPVREFYDLESLWVDAPRVQLRIPPEAVMAQPDALYGNL